MKRLVSVLLSALLCASFLFAEVPQTTYVWTAVPDHAGWLYRTGEKPVVEVSLIRSGVPVSGEKFSYSVRTVGCAADKDGEAAFKDGKAVIKLPSYDRPGFRETVFEFKDPQTGRSYGYHITLGFDVEKIGPCEAEPKDFMEFWQKSISENREKYPMDVEKKRLDDYCTAESDVYLVKIDIDGTHSLYGYLGVPKGAQPGSCPVALCPPGAGVKHIAPRAGMAAQGIITLTTEIHGINPMLSAEDYKDIYCALSEHRDFSYLTLGIGDRDRFYMKRVYLGLIRCLDYLASLPEWDGKNVIVRGGSQGGALSLVAAALDPRVTVCAAHYPAYANMLAGMKPDGTSGFPHYERIPELIGKDAQKTIPYYDVVHFAAHITCPVCLHWGYNDLVCPAYGSYAVWNSLKCEKESIITPINEHWATDETHIQMTQWIKSHLK